MAKQSAGILLYRRAASGLEVLLVHPGGPFWRSKDAHAWTLPKGELGAGETALAAAQRELREETGIVARGELAPLGTVTQGNGKVVHAWAVEQDADLAAICSSDFEMEWPPKSGQRCRFPEIDRALWLGLAEARRKIIVAQAVFLDRLAALVGVAGPPGPGQP